MPILIGPEAARACVAAVPAAASAETTSAPPETSTAIRAGFVVTPASFGCDPADVGRSWGCTGHHLVRPSDRGVIEPGPAPGCNRRLYPAWRAERAPCLRILRRRRNLDARLLVRQADE